MRNIIIVLLLILLPIITLQANPKFINLGINGGTSLSSGAREAFLDYHENNQTYSLYSKYDVHLFIDYFSWWLNLFVDYGLNNYFSIYSSAGYKYMHASLDSYALYDQYHHLVPGLYNLNHNYYLQLTGLDFNINAKLRLLHYYETLNYWIAIGPGCFIYKSKLKVGGGYNDYDFSSLSKTTLSEDSISTSWYLNLTAGMDIKLSRRWFLIWNTYLKIYLNDMKNEFKNIDYKNGQKGNDILYYTSKRPLESSTEWMSGFLGVGYYIDKEIKEKKEISFIRENKKRLSLEFHGISRMMNMKGDYFFTPYLSTEVGFGLLPFWRKSKNIIVIKENTYSLHASGKLYFFNSHWTPYLGMGFAYVQDKERGHDDHFPFYLPLGIEYMSDAGAVFGCELGLRCEFKRKDFSLFFCYKFGVAL